MTDTVTIIMSSFGTATCFGLVAGYLLNRQAKAADDRMFAAEETAKSAAAEVVRLRNETVKSLAEKVDRHVDADQSQRFGTQLDTVMAQNVEILRSITLFTREGATQAAEIKNTGARLDGVHKALREHTNDRSIHHA